MKSTFFAVATAAVLAACPVAFGHSFYDPECCSDRDCAPSPAEKVKETAAGFLLDTGEFVPRSVARPQSHDDSYHLCRSEFSKAILCFYFPNRSM